MADFETFLAQVRCRLEQGRADYGDRSLERPTTELVEEISEELCDVAGWAAVMWVRLERLRELAERVEVETADTVPPPIPSCSCGQPGTMRFGDRSWCAACRREAAE